MLRDLTGQTFGRLTVIERVQDHITKGGKHLVQWLCKCECGNHAVVLSANLKNGITKSCGCVRLESSRKKMLKIRETFELEDLCGRTINGFDVVGKSKPYKDPKYGYCHQQYICRCTHCGKTKLLRADILKQGKAVCKCNGKSCGRKHEDLTGRRFGKLVVTGYVRLDKPMIIKHKFKAKDCKSEIEVNRLYKNGSYYICQCDCGNVSYVKKSSLVGGKTTSCGCMKRNCSKAGCNMRGKSCDLTGQTFGNLTVIKQVDDYISPKGNHAKRYLCQCACGNHIEVQAGNLKSGNTVACSHSCPCKKKKYKPRDRNDLSGRVFGSLTVEKRVDDYVTPKGVHSSKYLCTCECGKQIEVISSHLASGHTKSCPRCILKKKDIVGQRFGKLVVKEYVETNKTTHVEKILKNKAVPNGMAVTYSYDAGNWYICQCDCGNITYVKRGQLINGQTKSCGCLKNKG